MQRGLFSQNYNDRVLQHATYLFVFAIGQSVPVMAHECVALHAWRCRS